MAEHLGQAWWSQPAVVLSALAHQQAVTVVESNRHLQPSIASAAPAHHWRHQSCPPGCCRRRGHTLPWRVEAPGTAPWCSQQSRPPGRPACGGPCPAGRPHPRWPAPPPAQRCSRPPLPAAGLQIKTESDRNGLGHSIPAQCRTRRCKQSAPPPAVCSPFLAYALARIISARVLPGCAASLRPQASIRLS